MTHLTAERHASSRPPPCPILTTHDDVSRNDAVHVDDVAAAGADGAGGPAVARHGAALCERVLHCRLAAGPARLLKPGIVGNGHVRAIAAGDDGRSFKLIAFRAAGTPLGEALLAAGAAQRWWLAGSIKRDEWNGGNAAEMHLDDAALA